MRAVVCFLRRLIPQRHPVRLLYHRVRGWLAAAYYGFPARSLRVIAVTGTDGKTTTVGMVAHVLRGVGRSVGAVSTAFFRLDDEVRWNETQKTSVPPMEFQRFLRRCVERRAEFVVVETSSHGLVQGRLGPLRPAVAAVTNTSLEHLDYHGSMEQYRADKGEIFRMLRGPSDRLLGRAGRGTKVLNRTDGGFAMYQSIPSTRTITFASIGRDPRGADLWLSDIAADATSTSALLHASGALRGTFPDVPVRISLPIPGTFNLENALCALGCAVAVGVPVREAVSALGSYEGTPGRLERIEEGQPFSVFVDFTVTPVAYERTLRALRAIVPDRRILVLTGSCGDRMREKRPMIGRVVSEIADVVAVSNEDPYTEDPLQIIEEVWSGIDPTRIEAHKIPDRREAIAFLLRKAQPGDAVILCAKGADTTMWTAHGQIPWDEREIVREMLREMYGS